MATELKSIKAKIEIPNPPKATSTYKETKVSLTRFYGGKERGVSLQLTFLNENGDCSHIQLDNENVQLLFDIINDAFIGL